MALPAAERLRPSVSRLLTAGLLACLSLVGVLTTPAAATFPGSKGKIAYTWGAGAIYVVNKDGTGVTNLTANDPFPHLNMEPAWSPDGAMIAFASNRDGNFEIYVMDADGSNQVRLTNNGADDEWPTWSPDGQSIAFSRTTSTSGSIRVMGSDGTGVHLVIGSNKVFSEPSWSPDGTLIAFVRTLNNGDYAIFDVAPNGTGLTKLTNPNGGVDQFPDWSPDGTRIAFSHRFGGVQSIWTMNPDGTNRVKIAGECNDHPAWSPDGAKIVFQRCGTASWDLYTMKPDGTGKRKLLATDPDEQFPVWQPLP